MSKIDNFQAECAAALRQLAVAIERGTMVAVQMRPGLLIGARHIEVRIAHSSLFEQVQQPQPTLNDWAKLKETRSILTQLEVGATPLVDEVHYYTGWPGRTLCGELLDVVDCKTTTRPSEVTCLACRDRQAPSPPPAAA